MADPQIVSCPGCGKRYSVPAGVAPGQFQCQDCSAVVAYGRGGAAPAAGHGHDVPARTHARAAAAKRKLARSRHAREDEDDGDDRHGRGHGYGGEKKQQNPAVYVMGLVGLVLFAGVIAFMVKSTPKAPPGTPAAGSPSGTPAAGGKTGAAAVPDPEPDPKDPGPRAPAPAPAPAPSAPPGDEAPRPGGGLKAAVRGGVPDKPDSFTPAANPPTGSHYGKSQAALLVMLRDKRPEVWVDPGHLPDTPSDLAAKIDADIAKMADVNGGSEFLRAQDRLIKVGRPALPKVVGLLSRLDFSKYSSMLDARDACALGDAIDNVMRGITGYDKIPALQYSPMDGKLAQYTQSLDEWCLWWFTIGYRRETFYKSAGAPEDEKL